MIIWFTGLSGAGKTTLSQYMHKKIKPLRKNTVYLDGDLIRKCFSMEQESDYSFNGRRKNAQRIHEFSLILDRQEINVICAIQLVFNDIRSLNRQVFSSYKEIHITCNMETLKKRDTKNLYQLYERNEAKNIVGIDIEYPQPINFNYELNTDEDINKTFSEIDLIYNEIISKLY